MLDVGRRKFIHAATATAGPSFPGVAGSRGAICPWDRADGAAR
jgi:hypothetical protein